MSIPLVERCLGNRFVPRCVHKAAFAAAMGLSLLASAVSAWHGAPAAQGTATAAAAATVAVEWPRAWDGAPLRPLALGEVEQRFAQHFPGAIARMTDGTQMLVLRRVNRPTRMLHPAADCYRALGWRIEQARLEQDAQARLWRCFDAQRGGGAPGARKLRVCERIVDAAGRAFTDTSAWYWAAVMGQSRGPWQAVTIARPLE